MGDPGGTYERGSVSGNMLIIRPTTAPTSQTNPQENGNFGVKKILEAKAVCRVCFEPVRGDAINICECSCPLLDLKCRYWVPDSAKCGYCKKEYQKIYVTVEPEQIPQGRQKRGLVSALKSGIHRFFSCASSPSVA
ncbi:uncharacterized protein LOC114309616 isoform X2 [Camellia sinensis]|uniref:uncharacterized protein LOC114309616 isoform X1 n=1 Tax=Camellia sinensis TaxID=4442 RepID=UPI0010366294|nr:uncharacterized protein LOC114309616 isoform X1 [Camellia sinensis]XP_028111207.1 uncharacterized protein LOC114309616 isoform X2 [Camellia sinensis]